MKTAQIRRGRPVLIAALVCTCCWLAAVATAAPDKLLLVCGAPLAAWSILLSLFSSSGRWNWGRCVMVTLLPWLVGSGAVFTGMWQLDRGGWWIYRVTGLDAIPEVQTQAWRNRPIEDFLDAHPEFVGQTSAANQIVLPAGEYTFRSTAIVPAATRLIIEPGTTIRFAAGCSLISYSPVIARGTKKKPIVFTAHNSWLKWGAVVLKEAGYASFEHVRFEHARHVSVNGSELPGGLSLIDTNAEIRDSSFTNMFGKDAVYVQRGNVTVCDNFFRNAYKDGLDLDDGTGTITGNEFIDCADEGIDLTGLSRLTVRDNTIRDRRGGRIGVDGDAAQLRLANTLEFSNRP